MLAGIRFRSAFHCQLTGIPRLQIGQRRSYIGRRAVISPGLRSAPGDFNLLRGNSHSRFIVFGLRHVAIVCSRRNYHAMVIVSSRVQTGWQGKCLSGTDRIIVRIVPFIGQRVLRIRRRCGRYSDGRLLRSAIYRLIIVYSQLHVRRRQCAVLLVFRRQCSRVHHLNVQRHTVGGQLLHHCLLEIEDKVFIIRILRQLFTDLIRDDIELFNTLRCAEHLRHLGKIFCCPILFIEHGLNQLSFSSQLRQIHICIIVAGLRRIRHDQVVEEGSVCKAVRNLHRHFQIIHAIDLERVIAGKACCHSFIKSCKRTAVVCAEIILTRYVAAHNPLNHFCCPAGDAVNLYLRGIIRILHYSQPIRHIQRDFVVCQSNPFRPVIHNIQVHTEELFQDRYRHRDLDNDKNLVNCLCRIDVAIISACDINGISAINIQCAVRQRHIPLNHMVVIRGTGQICTGLCFNCLDLIQRHLMAFKLTGHQLAFFHHKREFRDFPGLQLYIIGDRYISAAAEIRAHQIHSRQGYEFRRAGAVRCRLHHVILAHVEVDAHVCNRDTICIDHIHGYHTHTVQIHHADGLFKGIRQRILIIVRHRDGNRILRLGLVFFKRVSMFKDCLVCTLR